MEGIIYKFIYYFLFIIFTLMFFPFDGSLFLECCQFSGWANFYFMDVGCLGCYVCNHALHLS